ncbi:MAG: DUF3352 domain-containing protein, partial [Candidatus Promineifilaceae bacterium]
MSLESDTYEVSPPRSSNRRNMLIGGAAAVLLGCCALLFVVGIVLVVDPFGLNIFSRLTGRYDAAATVMPADTGFYVGVNLLNLDSQEIGRITQPFFEAAGDSQMDNLGDARTQIFEEIESQSGISFETDVVPWLGQYLGFGISEINVDSFDDVASVSWILAVEARNRGAADEFLIKLRDAVADSSGNAIEEQSYEGATLYAVQ